MAINESNVERDRFIAGDAAGDGKGDLLRTHAIKAEQCNSLLFYWLTGGLSEVKLLDTLPVARGDTGGALNTYEFTVVDCSFLPK